MWFGNCWIVMIGGGKTWLVLLDGLSLSYWLTDHSLIIVLGFSTGSNYSNRDRSILKPVLRKDPNLLYLPDPVSTEEEEEDTSGDTPPGTCVDKTSSEAVIHTNLPMGWSWIVLAPHCSFIPQCGAEGPASYCRSATRGSYLYCVCALSHHPLSPS